MQPLEAIPFEELPKRVRANLINGIAGLKPVNLIGTRSADGHDNLAVFSSVFHLGADPALQGFIVRPSPAEGDRHTLTAILDTGVFTINAVAESMIPKAHQTSARYPLEQSEFVAVGLTPQYRGDFPAPYVAESPIQIGLTLAEHQPLKINNTHLIIGAVQAIYLAKNSVRGDGSVAAEALSLVTVAGLDDYYTGHPVGRYRYAKPDLPATLLTP
jgi:flavin reductase (DIM6/NTAB) family NADH-FMN oxidoreductase RutF